MKKILMLLISVLIVGCASVQRRESPKDSALALRVDDGSLALVPATWLAHRQQAASDKGDSAIDPQASTSPKEDEPRRPTPPGINLARTSLASVTASSVNGNRKPDNKFYGILNAFDDGNNWHSGINYTYWLTNPGDTSPEVQVHFSVPVPVSAVVVENGPRFTAMLVDVKGREQHCAPSDAILILDKAIPSVTTVRLVFAGQEGNVRVDEIRVIGDIPPDTDVEVRVPPNLKTEEDPTKRSTRTKE